IGAIVPADRLFGAHHHGRDNLALLHGPLRVGLLDRRRDHVADKRVAAPGAALDANAQDLAGAGVVGHPQPGLVLDHRARSNTSISVQCLVRDRGLLSITRTMSPSWASLFSSCACSVLELRTIFS